jgi:hypothetical protein
MRNTHPDDDNAWGVMKLDRGQPFPSPHSKWVIGAHPAANNDTQYLGMTTPIDQQRHEINTAVGASRSHAATRQLIPNFAELSPTNSGIRQITP